MFLIIYNKDNKKALNRGITLDVLTRSVRKEVENEVIQNR